MVDAIIEGIEQDIVYALAKSADTLYAARASGLYRSQDGGNTWQDAFASLGKPLTAATVAACGRTVFAGVKGAILRSDDAGDNWFIAGLPSPAPLVVALALSPDFAEDETLAAATAEDGVFISADGGATWAAWNFGLIDLNVFSLVISPDFATDRTIFAGTESGIFRSHNGGRAWRETAFPMDAAPVISLAMSSGRLYAGTEENGLFSSDDSGKSWEQIENDLISPSVNAIHLTTSPNSEVQLLLDDKLISSTDGGYSWKTRQTLPADRVAMSMLSSSNTIWVGFTEGDISLVAPGK